MTIAKLLWWLLCGALVFALSPFVIFAICSAFVLVVTTCLIVILMTLIADAIRSSWRRLRNLT